MDSLTALFSALFCLIDDFCQAFETERGPPEWEKHLLAHGRKKRHRLFAGIAARGKSSTGWFFGFKLHIAINHRGELPSMKVTSGSWLLPLSSVPFPCISSRPRNA